MLALSKYSMDLTIAHIYKGKLSPDAVGGEARSTGGLLVKKNSPLVHLFNREIIKMKEQGEIEQIFSTVIAKTTTKTAAGNIKAEIGFIDVFTLFGLYALSIIFAFGVCSVELYICCVKG
jgi:hypothetical protein